MGSMVAVDLGRGLLARILRVSVRFTRERKIFFMSLFEFSIEKVHNPNGYEDSSDDVGGFLFLPLPRSFFGAHQ